ncbi:MAG: NUDIX hydrolase [Candidatus Micrarchaeota archaeon]
MYTHVQAVLLDAKGNALLLRKFDLFVKKKRWRLVKGTREKGERLEHTLKREVREETGLSKLSSIKRVSSYSYVDPKRGKGRVLSFKAFFEGKPVVTKDGRDEGIDAVRIVSAERALKMLFWKEEKRALKKAIR